MNSAYKVTVYGLPGVWGLPSPSPFVNKLLTWLRMAKIDYTFQALGRPPRSKTKKIPYIDLPDGSVLADSSRIIAHLSSERGVDLDGWLDDATRARGHLIKRMLEEHTYFAGIYERFATPRGWAHTSVDYFRHMPPVVRWLAPRLIRRHTMANLWGQGLGRQPPEAVEALARQDVLTLSHVLGEPYALGERASSFDATVTAFLWGFSAVPFDSFLKDEFNRHANLMGYLSRMRAEFWADMAPAAAP